MTLAVVRTVVSGALLLYITTRVLGWWTLVLLIGGAVAERVVSPGRWV